MSHNQNQMLKETFKGSKLSAYSVDKKMNASNVKGRSNQWLGERIQKQTPFYKSPVFWIVIGVIVAIGIGLGLFFFLKHPSNTDSTSLTSKAVSAASPSKQDLTNTHPNKNSEQVSPKKQTASKNQTIPKDSTTKSKQQKPTTSPTTVTKIQKKQSSQSKSTITSQSPKSQTVANNKKSNTTEPVKPQPAAANTTKPSTVDNSKPKQEIKSQKVAITEPTKSTSITNTTKTTTVESANKNSTNVANSSILNTTTKTLQTNKTQVNSQKPSVKPQAKKQETIQSPLVVNSTKKESTDGFKGKVSDGSSNKINSDKNTSPSYVQITTTQTKSVNKSKNHHLRTDIFTQHKNQFNHNHLKHQIV